MDTVTYGAAVAYVKQTANALGAVKGAPCTVKSITEGEEGSTIVFAWTGNDGVEQTGTTFIPRGIKGNKGDDGFSPDIKVTAINGGHRVTITDADGSQSFDVMDGIGGSGGVVEVDTTLTQEGKAADAKATGDAIKDLSEEKADWKQNDENAGDYIKNRPFYETDPVETVILPETTGTTVEQMGTNVMNADAFDLVEGQTYSIVFDGVPYECVAGNGLLGNPELLGETGGNNEPFAIIPYWGVVAASTAGEHTVSVATMLSKKIKIPNDFVSPDSSVVIVTFTKHETVENVYVPDIPFDQFEKIFESGKMLFGKFAGVVTENQTVVLPYCMCGNGESAFAGFTYTNAFPAFYYAKRYYDTETMNNYMELVKHN